MANTCTGNDVDPDGDPIPCDREAKLKGLCEKHYQQERRDRLGKVKPIAKPGEGDQVAFRLNAKKKAAIEKLAADNKRPASDYYREAVDEFLNNRGMAK